jgi:hypothetical protein
MNLLGLEFAFWLLRLGILLLGQGLVTAEMFPVLGLWTGKLAS